MFGYIRPFKPELKIREFETYKAIYCGLCSRLGQSFGPLARLTLSYDFTFLNMICEGISGEEPSFITCGCCVNSLKKVKMNKGGEAQAFSADVAALMIYHKLLDNIRDSGAFKRVMWAILYPFAKNAYKKASKSRPEAARIIDAAMKSQQEIERAQSASLDEACESSASAMAGIFALAGKEESKKRVLERLGYLIGRYVYICDALDDFDGDLKSGNYNPLAAKYRAGSKREDVLSGAKSSLYMTAGEITKTQPLLGVQYYEGIIKNITEQGLRAGADEIYGRIDEKPGRGK